jgi:hypothetical protein
MGDAKIEPYRLPPKKKRRAIRRVVFLIIGIVAVGWLALQFVGPYSTLRNRVMFIIGTARLQEWAVSVLDDPAREFAPGPEGNIDPKDLPEDIRPLSKHGFVVYVEARKDIGLEEHVLFACGGRFYHYGLRVGRPGFKPLPDSQYCFCKLADGVWGMYER